MSLVHEILVGHFDLKTFSRRTPACIRPLAMERVTRMLSSACLPPEDQASDRGDYLAFRWTGSQEMLDLIRRVAEAEDCYAIEMNNYEIMHHPRGEPGSWPSR